ncbi:hypothetical protein H0E87_004110 [Populus deltoides]|uniref:Uncharacterized protein n=1 Tax=Populus deltoides TaxID=3696 RepID=A0A8T2ZFB3_POPDE|nr:hypothetical protein H0E87_004110 [Populus deltoides]
MEGEGSSSEMEFTEVETNTDSGDNSVIFRVTKSVIGFVLYMHQQIPSILLDISLEFDTLQTEYKELLSVRRDHLSRMRGVKRGIRRLEKLVNTVGDDGGFTKSKVAEGLSRKVAHALISKVAGSSSYPGPTKLFLLVKAPASFNLPLHFLPKRDIRYCKKAWIVPTQTAKKIYS